MDIKLAQQETITELILENQKLKLDAQREAEHHDRMVGELEKVYKERDEAREDLEFRRGLYKVEEEYLEKAREQIKELIYIADRAIDLADIDLENDKFGVVSELRSDLEKIKGETK